MKAFLPIVICIFMATHLFGQAPQQFSFQGVARNVAGQVVANSTVSLRLTVLKNSAFGETVYRETHKPKTSQGGTFSVIVGTGISDHGQFSDVDWKAASWFLRVETDPAGGTAFVDMGTTQFLSVPFAIYANESAKAANADKALVADNAMRADSAKEATHAVSADKFQDDKLIVLKGSFPNGETLGTVPNSSAMIWYPKKGAFRAGLADNGKWDDVNTGDGSAAFNWMTKASGKYSAAFGQNTEATGNQSFAIGREAHASGENALAVGRGSIASNYTSVSMGQFSYATGAVSVAMGGSADASGDYSVALGLGAEAKGEKSVAIGEDVIAISPSSISIGKFNEDHNDSGDPVLLQRLFQLGNGSGSGQRSNAMTVLKNGNIGIGKGALLPQYILDIDGRPRLRHNGQSAGLFLNSSSQNPDTFIGMKQDDQVGFYLGNTWRFWVDKNSNGYLGGSLLQTSDKRLKKDFRVLDKCLAKLGGISGYHFNWKNTDISTALQTGLIAQEVETVFPELVSTNKEGYKAVNYIGFIPHLIEAVKELRAQVQALETQNAQLTLANEKLAKNNVSGATVSSQAQAMAEVLKRLGDLEAKLHLQDSGSVNAASK